MPAMSAPPEKFSILIASKAWQFEAEDSVSVLEAARRSQFALPASCRNGTCRTCICRLLSGRIRYLVEWPGLSADEKKDGYMLPCVAIAESDLVIDFD